MRIIISYKMFVVNSSAISLEGVGTHMTEVELNHWRVPSPLNILTEGGPGTSCKRRASRAPPPRGVSMPDRGVHREREDVFRQGL